MKKTLRILALVLAVVMGITVLASCQQKTEKNHKTPSTEQQEAKTEPVPGTNAETPTEAPTEAVVTNAPTEAVTEAPPKEEVWYDVYRWTFDDPSDLGWYATNNTEIEAGEDGTMICTVTGADPHVSSSKALAKAKLQCDDIERIVFRIKNNTEQIGAQLFISTTESPGPDESYSIKFDYEYDSEEPEWEEIIIETWEINGWEGRLKDLRFDYSEAGEGVVYVDSIIMPTTTPEKALKEEEQVTEEPDPRAGKEVIYTIDFSQITAEKCWFSKAEHGEEEEKSDDMFVFSNGVDPESAVENDYFVCKIAGQDPFIMCPVLDVDIATEAISCAVITVCNRASSNNVAGQFFYMTDGNPDWSEAGSEHFAYVNGGEENTVFEEIVIELEESNSWYGALLQVRFDPSEAWGGECWIKTIEFYGK